MVGGVLSVWVVVRDTLALELFPCPSVTVSIIVLLIELFNVGLEKDLVKVYVFPDTFVCVPPLPSHGFN